MLEIMSQNFLDYLDFFQNSRLSSEFPDSLENFPFNPENFKLSGTNFNFFRISKSSSCVDSFMLVQIIVRKFPDQFCHTIGESRQF